MKFQDLKYERPDFKGESLKINEKIKLLNETKNSKDAILIIDQINAIIDKANSMMQLANIRSDINTLDEFYSNEVEWLDENYPDFMEVVSNFQKVLVSLTFKDELKDYYGKQYFQNIELELKTFSPIIKEELVKESKLSNKYSKLLASAKIEFDGKINNLQQLQTYMHSLDREVRKNAELAKAAFMESHQDELDTIYDELVHVRDTIAKKMGFDNYLEYRYLALGRSDYDYKDVRVYRNQIYKFFVPLAKDIIEETRKRLSLEKLYSYDMAISFKDGNPKPKGSKDELVAKAKKMYEELSKETGEFFNFMVENDAMDLETKEGKSGGGYCDYLPYFKTPFIFSNFNGTSGDVDVLTHEAGHAFQVYTASKEVKVSSVLWPSYEAAEIHSMSMEFLTYPWMESFFKEDVNKYRYSHLCDAINFLPYGVAVDEFQEWVYLNPNALPDERNKTWRSIEKKYEPWIDYHGLKYYESGRLWQRQGHIYESPLYYIDYTLAQVCAFYFYLLDLKDHKKAFEKYYNLCKMGGTKSFVDLLKSNGIINPFEDGTLEQITKDLKKVLVDLEKEC